MKFDRLRKESSPKGAASIAASVASPLVLILFTLLLTLVLRELLDWLLELNLNRHFWYRDFLGNLVVSMICLGLTQRLFNAIALSGLFIVIFQVSNAVKLVVLGTPISPDDFINVKNLFMLWQGPMLWFLVVFFSVPILAVLCLTRWHKAGTWLTLALLGVSIPLGGLYSAELKTLLDGRFGNSVWNQPENFKRRGLGLHLVQETVRTLSKVGKVPNQATVEQYAAGLKFIYPDLNEKPKRNVHMVVLESFFDPNSLGKEWVPQDPFPPEFTQLWNSTGRSTILSPVFGGYTANAEFESLCGFPVTENAVFFEGWLRRSVPCLPQLLSAAGYQSIASHPNVAGFWNRTQAYKLMGFAEYWSKSDFDTSDAVGNFVLDHSFYEQVFEKLANRSNDSKSVSSDNGASADLMVTGNKRGAPVFNYMLTLHGHLPYPRNDNYPDKVNAGKDAKLLQGYLNHLYYKSRDLMIMLDWLRADDPDALIVIFGDHLPYLDKNYGIHSDAGKLMSERDDFDGDMYEYLVSTPLIVIDGQRGPLATGKLPLYRLPALVLELLGVPSAGMSDWTVNPVGKLIRPVYGMHFYLQDGETIVCQSEDVPTPQCSESEQWMKKIKTLIADIFTGKQFSLHSTQDAIKGGE